MGQEKSEKMLENVTKIGKIKALQKNILIPHKFKTKSHPPFEKKNGQEKRRSRPGKVR